MEEPKTMFTPVSHRAAHAYNRVAVDSAIAVASPHALIAMLFTALVDSLSRAETAILEGNVSAKSKAISKAIRILDEGLAGSLNAKGGEIAENLGSVYQFGILELSKANEANDPQAVARVLALITPIAESWKAIGPEVDNKY